MKKLLFCAMALMPVCVSAQSLIVNLKSGEIMKVPVADIQSLSFKESPQTPDVPVEENVPLAVFKDPVLQAAVARAAFGNDTEGKTELTPEEVASIKELSLNYSDVASLEGIENLKELTGLYISGCEKLTSVDLSNGLEKLEELYAGMCTNLETLVLGNKPALTYISAYSNSNLTTMDFAGLSALEQCAIYGAKLSSIEIHTETLKSLNCGNSDLEGVDLSGCTNLQTLSLDNSSKITEFSISEFPNLEEFSISGGDIKRFTTEGCKNLKKLILDFNTSLSYLDVSKSLKLSTLSCSSCFYYGEDGTVIMAEGQEIPNMTGVMSWFIERVPRELPDDVAAELTDAAFRQLMLDKADKDGDGKISAEEAEAVTELNASGLGLTSVDFFYFNNIEVLDLSDNNLTEIDLSMTKKIVNLNLNNNKLTSLNVEVLDDLQYLYANNNELATVSRIGSSKIEEIDLSYNKLTTISPSYKYKLVSLNLSHNELTDVTLTYDEALANLNVSYNNLKSMQLWSLTGLVDVDFSNNPFTELDHSTYWVLLQTIDCSNTDIKTLNLSQNADLKKCVASDCANLETIYVPEGSEADVVKGDNTEVVYGAPASEE